MSAAASWPFVRLGDVITVHYGRALPKPKRAGGNILVFGSNGAVGAHDKALTSGPTIVIGRKGSSGAVNSSSGACWPIDTTFYVDDPGPYSLGFLELVLRSLDLEHLDRSTAIPGLSREQLYDLEVPLPPVGVQDSLARFVEQAEGHRSSSLSHLRMATTVIERLQLAVLAAGVSGRLTQRWREERPPRGRRPRLPGAPRPIAAPIDAPEDWSWLTLGDVAELQGGIQVGATRRLGEPLRSVPYLRVANVQKGRLDLSEMKTILAPEGTIRLLRLQPGDMLFNEGGDRDKLGRGWIWEGQIAECIHQNHVFRGRLYDTRMQPRFYSWYGNTIGMSYFFSEGKQTVNLASLSKTKLSQLPVPVPSIEEQAEIVRRVEGLMSLVEQLQGRVQAATHQVERSSQALLAKSLRGEPAEVAV